MQYAQKVKHFLEVSSTPSVRIVNAMSEWNGEIPCVSG